MDSDLTNDPRDIPRFAARMHDGVDVIKASRYTARGPHGRRPVATRDRLARRQRSSRGRSYRLPLRDCTNGFRAVRTSLLTRMRLEERGFPVIMEELYWCRFLATSFAEVPVTLTRRRSGVELSVQAVGVRGVPAVSVAARFSATMPRGAQRGFDEVTRMRQNCRGCEGRSLEIVFDFGPMPLAGGFLVRPGSDRRVRSDIPLQVHVCRTCALVQILDPDRSRRAVP